MKLSMSRCTKKDKPQQINMLYIYLKWLTVLWFILFRYMPELEIGIAYGSELNFDQSFLRIVLLGLNLNTENETLLA